MRTKYERIDIGVRIRAIRNTRFGKAGQVWEVGQGISEPQARQLVNDGAAEVVTVTNKRRRAPSNKAAV